MYEHLNNSKQRTERKSFKSSKRQKSLEQEFYFRKAKIVQDYLTIQGKKGIYCSKPFVPIHPKESLRYSLF